MSVTSIEGWCSVRVAAERMGVREQVIRDWIRRGHLQPERRQGRVAVHMDDVFETDRNVRKRDRTGTATRRVSPWPDIASG